MLTISNLYITIISVTDKGEKMERRNGRVSFHKSGSGRGAKVTIPIPWLRKMGISEENREITFIFDEENQKLIIEKK